MDGALWLLLRLRLTGFLRRWGRSLRTMKGLLLALVGSLLYLPMLLTTLIAPRVQLTAQIAMIRRYGALGLFGFCVLNLVLTSDERAVYFAPAEIEFLFSGPFRRRQLLFYKMVNGFFSSVLVALLMTFFFAHHARSFLPAFIGLFLMIEELVLLSMGFGLFVSTVGALAFNRQRRIAFGALLVLGIAALLPRSRDLFSGGGLELLDRLERSPVLRVAAWPFRPPVMAFTAEHLWPELAGWSLQGVALLAGLAIGVLALDAEYYEATAAASTRIYDQARARMQGGTTARAYRTPIQLPMLPWWGGVGPALWRQLASAVRFPGRFFTLLFLHLGPMLPMFLGGVAWGGLTAAVSPGAVVVAAILATLSLAASMVTGFDFRSDLDRMDTLKSLPIPTAALVIAEIAVPTLMLTVAQGACLALLAGVHRDTPHLLEVLLFLPPYNALLVEVEAILFLWFPNRIVPGSSMDFSMMGRQLLLMFTKLMVVGFTGGVAVGIGALCYGFVVPSWPLALVLTWLFMAGFVAAMVPLAVTAFQQFDVARDAPP
jgi:Putative ABC exporter